MNTIALTDTQRLILTHAIEHTDGCIDWFPEHIKGGARRKVLEGLSNRSLVTQSDDGYAVSTGAYEALELPRPSEPEQPPTAVEDVAREEEADADAIECVAKTAPTAVETTSAPSVAHTPRTRAHSKQAQVIALLRRPEGATIEQIMLTTGWLKHTVRGTLSGAVRKRLGLNVVSHKSDGGARIYRIE